MFFRAVGESAPKSKSFKSRVAFAACGKLPAEAVIRPGTNPLIHSMLCKFSRLLFACAPLLLVAAALVPAAPADAADIDICDRSEQVQEAIIEQTAPIRSFFSKHLGIGVNCAQVDRASLREITVLDLSSRSISKLKDGDFRYLISLRQLDLSDNLLRGLPEGIFKGAFTRFIDLEEVNLSNNRLKRLPRGVFKDLISLRQLDLSDNLLQGLPKGIFKDLTSLEELRLSRNELKSLPAGVFSGLELLKELRLSSNELKSLPAGVFSDLAHLRILRLSRNRLQSLLQGSFSNLISLEELWLSHNQLQSLRKGELSGLSSLEKLWLSGNELKNLRKGEFSGLDHLEELRISHNKLERLPEDVFNGLGSLRRLDLSNNLLRELPEDIFGGLSSLEDLRLYSNLLLELPEEMFSGLSSLRQLSLSNNRFKELPKGIFSGLSELQVYLHDNPGGESLGEPEKYEGGEVGGGSWVALWDNYGTSDDLIDLLEEVEPASPDDKKWLFVIGAEDYKNTDSIVYSRRSAERFVEVASKVFGIEPSRRVVLLENATGGAIEDGLKAMLGKVREGESIYFYYSGHGIPIRNSATNENTPYMLATDHDPSLIEEKEFYNLNNIYDILNESQASKVLVMLDSCFSGSTDGKGILQGVAATRLSPDLPLLDGEGKMAVITAGTDDEYSNALPGKQHRLFSYYLMRALLTGKYRNIGDLHATVYDAVVEESRNLGGTNRQTPQLQGNPNLTF